MSSSESEILGANQGSAPYWLHDCGKDTYALCAFKGIITAFISQVVRRINLGHGRGWMGAQHTGSMLMPCLLPLAGKSDLYASSVSSRWQLCDLRQVT